MNPISYKIETILQQYENLIAEEKNGKVIAPEEKEKFTNTVMNILSMRAMQLSQSQADAIIKFRDRLSPEHPEDRVVQLASNLANSILAIRQKFPKEIVSQIASHLDIPTMQYINPETQQRITSQAINWILAASPEDLNVSDLLQYTKILTISWDEPYVKNSQKVLVDKLKALMGDKMPTEFNNLAIGLIKQYDTILIPNDISNLPYFHGNALSKGYQLVIDLLKVSGKSEISLSNFVDQYCKDKLVSGKFLLRNSSTIPSTDVNGIKYFTVTLSYKANNILQHIRITRVEDQQGKVSWKQGNPPFDPNNSEIYDSFEDYRNKKLIGYTPLKAPSDREMVGYVQASYELDEDD